MAVKMLAEGRIYRGLDCGDWIHGGIHMCGYTCVGEGYAGRGMQDLEPQMHGFPYVYFNVVLLVRLDCSSQDHREIYNE